MSNRIALMAFAALAFAPSIAPAQDSTATLRVKALRDTVALPRARVTGRHLSIDTDANGTAVLRLEPGPVVLVVSRIGFTPDTVSLRLRPAQDTTVVVTLVAQPLQLEPVIVAATRSERRIEETPLRVEVVDEEEVAEKVAMTPGDIAMMLNETSGLRVQTTSPSLGGASVRVQGLRGRYTLILSDGLPLYGAQTGGLGLLQIPPVDLARAEVIKGTASALYGSSALGGVINLISRRPTEGAQREVLVNQTSRGGTDAVFFGGTRFGAGSWGGTLLASAHRQTENDLDHDGWADMAGFRRLVLRPRLFYDNQAGSSLYATFGHTHEDRDGGTLAGRVAPDGIPFAEGLHTHRTDFGTTGRILLGGRDLLSARASGVEQRHGHQFGPVGENDVHRTWFAEVSAAVPRGRSTSVLGLAYQEERYRNRDIAGFDYSYHIPAAFAQLDFDAGKRMVLSGSVRLDQHSQYGTSISPRLSALLKLSDDPQTSRWTLRVSGGKGAFGPVPFTEETEVTGLAPLRRLNGLRTERALGGSADLNGSFQGSIGRMELNATLFASTLQFPVMAVADTGTTSTGASFIALLNAPLSSHTRGAEILVRLIRGIARVTASYTRLASTEWDPELGTSARRTVPLTPGHSAGLVASVEQDGRMRLGLELYYVGSQTLEENPYRTRSRPYVLIGLLAEKTVATSLGRARFFVNAENIGNVRQTRYDPLLLPIRGKGGRWTVDGWTDPSGFVLNGGIRLFM